MSVITYIGLNFEVKVTNDITDDPIQFTGFSGSKENGLAVRESHFKTSFVYELWEEAYPSFKSITNNTLLIFLKKRKKHLFNYVNS